MNSYMATGACLLVAFGLGSPAWAQPVDPLCRPSMMWSDGWHGWFVGPVMMILFLAIAVAVIFLIVRWLGGNTHGHSAAPSGPPRQHAIDILKDRFARGEIDKEEFEKKRQLIEK
ncbi:SHOCT domain-containing protein [Kordiimonas aquimaris]|uniref:SHOCT domain-containing protein n=1 Tax=Kordiimonas aquimaris TaxID=707591 RepID=UPI0021CE9FA2|nr:SHOCT domain-containing protein [Kordiimonas aquimaris]